MYSMYSAVWSTTFDNDNDRLRRLVQMRFSNDPMIPATRFEGSEMSPDGLVRPCPRSYHSPQTVHRALEWLVGHLHLRSSVPTRVDALEGRFSHSCMYIHNCKNRNMYFVCTYAPPMQSLSCSWLLGIFRSENGAGQMLSVGRYVLIQHTQ